MTTADHKDDVSPLAAPSGHTGPLTLSERAYQALSRMIQDRALPIGRPIVEAQLAQRLGISRTPLRQALQRLEADGLLRKLESRSYVLRRVDLKEYLQSLKVREILEGEAVALAIHRVSAEDIARARDKVHAVQDQVPYDMHAHWASDEQVHALYIDACPNLVIREILQSLRVTTKLFEIEWLAERLKPDSRQHLEILDALEARDPARARGAVEAHLRSLTAFAIETV